MVFKCPGLYISRSPIFFNSAGKSGHFYNYVQPDGDGLACYRRQQNGERLGRKQPWEVRNWGVNFWFWRKWRLLKDSSAIDAGQLVNDTGCGGFVMAGALKRFSA